jgi:arylsulfatase A-like enzyme
VANIDVAATLFDAAGVNHRTDGRSLLARRPRSELLLESIGSFRGDRAEFRPPFRSLRTAQFRYAEYYRHGTEGGGVRFTEYYDLGADPWELENRAPELSPSQNAELSRRLEQYAFCEGRACP